MKKLLEYILFAVAVDALAIVFLVDTFHMPRAAYQMPRIFIALILLLSVLMIVEQALQTRKRSSETNGNGASESNGNNGSGNNGDPPPPELSPVRIVVFVALIFAYIMTINPLGYFIATPAFLVATLVFLRSTKLPWVAAIAVGFTGFVYLLFVLFLHMPVPMGLLD
ncbi:MAG: tripartite tricarboxylate transporter TctB family protein [Verrucomicrobiota bacterium]